MSRLPTGTVRLRADGVYTVRVTIKSRERVTLQMPTCRTQEQADDRALLVSQCAQRLRESGMLREIEKLCGPLARARQAEVTAMVEVIQNFADGTLSRAKKLPTFGEIANEWTSGKLSRLHPDNVPKIDQRGNVQRLRDHILPLIGDHEIVDVNLTVCELVMAQLDKSLSVATRRHVAQILKRVLEMSAYPLKLIPVSPLPKGFLPKLPPPKAGSYLYPDEEARLVGLSSAPFHRRLVYGLLAREGMRVSECVALDWASVDLQRGTITLDDNKTDDPRAWACDRGTLAVLFWLRQQRAVEGAKAKIVDHPIDDTKIATVMRRDLRAAGVTREILFTHTERRMQIRAHDLRATFVTLALATGRTETWVADRTGHKSSQMINRYRRAARAANEVGTGWLFDFADALGIAPAKTKGDKENVTS